MRRRAFSLVLSALWGRGAWGTAGTVAAALACAAGLFAVSLSVQLALDLREAFGRGTRGLAGREYVVVSKRIALGAALAPQKTAFTREEIAAISSRPGIVSVHPVISNRFEASLTLELGGTRLGTEIFYESVPDGFLGATPRGHGWPKGGARTDAQALPQGWDWREDGTVLPIMISRDFLALYNLGFASSRGLPPVSESLLALVRAQAAVAGPGGSRVFQARIVGLTDRLSSILVPQSFMSWANRVIAREEEAAPRRLVVETEPAAATGLSAFLESRGWERAREGGAAAGVLELGEKALTAAGAGGTLLAVVAVLLYLLSVSLTVERSRESIRVLRLLGYSRMRLGWALAASGGAGILAAALVGAGAALYVDAAFRRMLLESLGAAGSGGLGGTSSLGGAPAAVIVTACGLVLLFTALLFGTGLRLIARLDRERG